MKLLFKRRFGIPMSIFICLLVSGLVSILMFLNTAYAQGAAVVYLGEEQEALKPLLEKDLKQIFPGAAVEFIHYQDPQARQIIQQFNIRFLPFVFLNEGIINTPNFMALVKNGTIEKTGNLFHLSPQTLKPYGCYVIGSKKIPGQLDVYVMSFCPFWQQALRELFDFIRNEDSGISLNIRFITNFRDYGIDSPRGPQEIKEDVRQLIIQKDYPGKLLDYILARQEMPFEDAFSSVGIDKAVIDAKEQEGLAMLNQDAQLSVFYGIDVSPAFLWENEHIYFSWQGFKPVLLEFAREQKEKKEEARKQEEQKTKPKKKGWFGR
ncbi:MAG: hypothetical protein ABH914_01900 [Candidatus Omnitrophota bacterium]